jgi:VIT1/CCC1 family predicted Fe2+/Mn2+ transporter
VLIGQDGAACHGPFNRWRGRAAKLTRSRRSEAQAHTLPTLKTAGYHGLATFIGFIAAGIVPLLAYLLPWFDGARFAAAIALALGTLFVVGATRAFFTSRGWLASGLEMLLLGSFAALVAYCIGAIGASIIGNH